MRKFLLLLFAVVIYLPSSAQHDPSFEELISLKAVRMPVISPDGEHIVFEVRAADWKDNSYDSELWISKNGGTPIPLTNNPKGSSSGPRWSPGSDWILFSSKRGERSQLHVIRSAGGEAFQVTDLKQNIRGYEWSPDGLSIGLLLSEDLDEVQKTRKDKYGAFVIEDQEFSNAKLWTLSFFPDRLTDVVLPAQLEDSSYKESQKPKIMIDSFARHITDFKWSPDGKKIAIEHRTDPLINSFFKSDISIYDVDQEKLVLLVNNASYDGFIDWSPDGNSILYSTHLDDTVSNYYKNNLIFRIDLDGTDDIQLATDIDEDIGPLRWTKSGIFGLAWQKTNRNLLRVNPVTGLSELLPHTPNRIYNFTTSVSGEHLAYYGNSDNSLTEIFLSDLAGNSRQLTSSTDQIGGWSVAQSEVIRWNSEDGTQIEGVLLKPKDFDPSRTYPLMVATHGGPTGISTPGPVQGYVYPLVQWLNKGAIALLPNYRGSAGYGEEFRSLNVRNLGVGDAWDVESGVQHLIDQGIADPEKVAAMGWSQGGYISAFLSTNSKLFSAISVGAGISNWMTYYVNTDIHPFTRQYLKATPWSDKEIYERTSPMTNIKNSSTPTLIQHGEFDKRVPTANAYELFQGLQDVGVDTKLIIYKGFGHGITKPKERLAAMWHNWQWFGKYIWDEEIEIPEKTE